MTWMTKETEVNQFKDGKFLDMEFPPVKESLITFDGVENYIDLFEDEIQLLKDLSFWWASSYFHGDPKVFNDINPNDIV